MPITNVKAPNGEVIPVRHPDGASEAEIIAYAQANYKPPAAPEQKRGIVQTAADKVGAFASGFNRAYVSRAGLPFNPVDAAANVLDLGKAAIGAPYIALTGKEPPSWLQLNDRASVPGSGESIINLIRQSELGRAALDAPNPEDQGGLVQALGGGAGGSVGSGASRSQEVVNAGMGSASALASKVVGDLTGNDALAVAAGFTPQAGVRAGSAGVKRVIRGNEAGRKEMAQRVQDLQNAGVDNPTLGLASGNKVLGGIENILQSTPGAVSIMQRNRDAAMAGLEGRVGQAADLASTNRGAMESGRSIQSGAKLLRENFKTQQTALYDRLDQFLNPQAQVQIPSTQATLSALNADIPTMPQLSRQFKNGRIQAIESALQNDMQSSPTQQILQVAKGGGGIMNAPVVTQLPAPSVVGRTTIPFEALKKTRTLVGNELADSSIISDVPRSKWNPLYGSLSDDMQVAAANAGPGASGAFNRATDFTRAGLDRLDRIAPIVNRDAPEQSFAALAQTLKENTSTFQAVKKSLPQDARGDFAGTIIERLGKATPGQQDATGGKWSPETFLTNWSKISQKGQAELLSGIPNAAEVKAMVDSVARATALMRDNSQMWANPSGTAANASARAVLGGIGLGTAGSLTGLLNPLVPLGAAATVGGTNLLARGLTSPTVRDFVSRQPVPADLLSVQNPALLQQLINNPQLSGLLTN